MMENRVLVVDDDDALRLLIKTLLRDERLEVDSVRDGVDALQKLAQVGYQVVVLDLKMPRMDGFALAQKIGAMPPATRPAVIAITGADDDEVEQLDRGVVGAVVRKPFDLHSLVEFVQQLVLERAAAKSSLEDTQPAGSGIRI